MSNKWNLVDFLFGQLWFGAVIKNQNMYMHIIVHLSMGSRAPHFSIYFYGVIFLLVTPSLSIFQCFQNGYASNIALTLLFPLTMTVIGPSVFFNFLFLSVSLVSPAFCGCMYVCDGGCIMAFDTLFSVVFCSQNIIINVMIFTIMRYYI